MPLARLLAPFQRFFRLQTTAGVVLLAVTVIALVWANAPCSSHYFAVGHAVLAIRFEGAVLEKTLAHWINDGLMSVFFLLVGLELKREVLSGELRSVGRAALPVAAALGGMLVPAGIYWAVNAGRPTALGFGIPMATDIAFALAALSALGARVPASLRVFLSALAIADDLGAILVIAFVYATGTALAPLAGAAGCLLVLAACNALGVRKLPPYLLIGVVLWLCVLKSGVHATLAGVLLALTIPATRAEAGGESPLEQLEHALHPFVTWAVLPVFAFVNAGVVLQGEPIKALGNPVTLGTVLGLVIGKPLGIVGATWLCTRLGLAPPPEGAMWRNVAVVGCLAGIGFTMSLFVAELAFEDEGTLAAAKQGILFASALAALLGGALAFCGPRPRAISR